MAPDTPPAESRTIVRTFALASFLHDIGSDMVFAVWPLFVRDVLGADMTVLGLVDGLGDAVVSLSQAVSGYLSDKWRKRKVFIWMGYLWGGAARVGYALTFSWPLLIPWRILDRSGKIRGSPRDAIVSDVSTPQTRGRNFGTLRLMDNAGAVVGILLSIFLIRHLGFRTIFAIAALPSLAAVALVLVAVKERKAEGVRAFKGIRLRDFDGNLRLLFLASALLGLGSFSYSFLLLYANASGFGDGAVPVLYLVFTAVAAVASYPVGRLSDRVGRKALLYASLVCWALVAVSFVYVGGAAGIIAGFLLYGLHKGILDTVHRAFVADLAPKDFTASTLGGFQLVMGLCAFPASLIAGVLWDRAGPGVPFLFSLALTAASFVLLLFVREQPSPASISA
jgi:MFS family permease